MRSMFEVEHKSMLFFAIFYLIAGIANFVIMVVYGFGLFHVAIVALLSLIAGFGLYRLQNWSLWFVVSLFFITTTYGALMLNTFLEKYTEVPDIANLVAIVAWLVYLLLTWISTVYVTARRKNLR